MSPLDSVAYGIDGIFDSKLPSSELEFKAVSKIWKRWENIGLYRKNPLSRIGFITGVRAFFTGRDLLFLLGQRIEARFDDSSVLPLVFTDEVIYRSVLSEGPEFLMGGSQRGTTLDQLMRLNEVDELYGPLILKVMELNGYATIQNPQNKQFRLNPKEKARAKIFRLLDKSM